MKKLIILSISLFLFLFCSAQQPVADTVVVELAKSSKLTLTIHDRDDLELLRHYDFQGLFDDILSQLEDEQEIVEEEELENIDEVDMEAEDDFDEEYEDEENDDDEDEEYGDFEDDEDEEDCDDVENWGDRISGSLDLGIGNYLSPTGFPDEEGAQYAVKPWGSWYVGFGSIYHMRVTESFKVDWGLGLSFYNFKFEDEKTLLTETATGVEFSRDTRDFVFLKSKLSVNYINLSVLPMVEFGRYLDGHGNWKGHKRNFRIGAGVYGGYRLHSYTKQKYEVADEVEKEKNKDNFYLNNLRYGLRFQFGIHDVDFFFNYDLNTLFAEDRGPKLNAYSFGLVF